MAGQVEFQEMMMKQMPYALEKKEENKKRKSSKYYYDSDSSDSDWSVWFIYNIKYKINLSKAKDNDNKSSKVKWKKWITHLLYLLRG